MRPPTVAPTLPGDRPDRPPRATRVERPLLDMVGLSPLMDLTAGRPEVIIGLIDGPVARDHPDLATHSVRLPPGMNAACAAEDASCRHGTFVAGILAARRGTSAPAICPGCTLLLRPIFGVGRRSQGVPSATPQELAAAMLDCMEGGAQILNVSAALAGPLPRGQRELLDIIDLAARRGVLVVVAAGNQPIITSSVLTRHPWVIPVVAYSRSGQPLPGATLGRSIGRRGLGAPGEAVSSLAPGGGEVELGGSSAAAPFVSGAAALIRSLFPEVPGAELRLALASGAGRRRPSVVPPLLDAWGAHQALGAKHRR